MIANTYIKFGAKIYNLQYRQIGTLIHSVNFMKNKWLQRKMYDDMEYDNSYLGNTCI